MRKLGGEIIAVATESKPANDPEKTLAKTEAPFLVLNNVEGAWLDHYQKLYVYIIDAQGAIRRIFAATISERPAGKEVVDAFEEVAKRRP